MDLEHAERAAQSALATMIEALIITRGAVDDAHSMLGRLALRDEPLPLNAIGEQRRLLTSMMASIDAHVRELNTLLQRAQ